VSNLSLFNLLKAELYFVKIKLVKKKIPVVLRMQTSNFEEDQEENKFRM
jgi:hypothetical protein